MKATTSKHSGRIEVNGGLKYIAGLQNTAKVLFAKALEFDSLPSDTVFVTFSTENKFAKLHSICMNQYFEAIEQYKAGGYVGLQLR